MDSRNHSHSAFACIVGILSVAIFPGVAFSQGVSVADRRTDPYAAWAGSLTPVASPLFPTIAPFVAEYRFGWEGIGAGGAKVRVNEPVSGRRMITVEGGPNAWVRKLWNYQALYCGEAGSQGETPSWFHMEEGISRGDLLSDAFFKQGSVFSCHRLIREKKPWELTLLPGVRDLFAAMLFVRSQPLRDGDTLRLTVFPDQSPYLVDLCVAGRETLVVTGKSLRAIRFTIRIRTIETHGEQKGRLAPHRKFHSGRIWMSDDARRIPLRAEVDTFIGRVFAEMSQITPSL